MLVFQNQLLAQLLEQIEVTEGTVLAVRTRYLDVGSCFHQMLQC